MLDNRASLEYVHMKLSVLGLSSHPLLDPTNHDRPEGPQFLFPGAGVIK